jgi:hypothetical protein
MNNNDFPLHTEVEIKCPKWDINYRSKTIFIGSCFSDNIGGIFQQHKLPVLLNPFGVLYNPSSISKALLLSIKNQPLIKEELVQHDALWHSFYFHGSFSNINPDTVISTCNAAIATTHQFLKSANYLFITLGTAWVYKHIATETVVSNCHKIPDRQFHRYRMTVNEIVEEWDGLLTQLQAFNPELKIVFTVSPIRHLKDGAHENQLSKSVLLLAIDEIMDRQQGGRITYFPAYELVNDELRDYRFYNSDMIHISETAIRYIFEKVKVTFFSTQTSAIFKQIAGIVQATEHRIMNNNQETLRQFSHTMLTKIEKAQSMFPYINFQEEVEHFTRLSHLK